MKAEESRAWALYYHAMALSQDNVEYEQLLKQSLVLGKSPILRYLASYHLNHLDGCKADDRLTYRLQNVEAARATTWTHAEICSLHDLFITYYGLGQYQEARELQRQIAKYSGPFANGVSLFCQGRISLVIGKYEECMDLFRSAIKELEKVEVNIDAYSIKRRTMAQILVLCRSEIVQCQIMLNKVETEGLEGEIKRFEETALRGVPSDGPIRETYEIIFLRSEALLLMHKSKHEEAKNIYLKLLTISRKDAKYRVELGHEALLRLAKIAFMSGDREDIEKHFLEAEELVSSYPLLLWSVLDHQAEFYLSIGQFGKAREKFAALLDMHMETPPKFDSSMDRISFIDNIKNKFHLMELSIINRELLEGQGQIRESKSLLWAERQRGRDFLYSLEEKKKKNRHGANYLNNSSTFDKNDEAAVSELISISELAGTNTIFIYFSKFCSYFIQDGKPPLLCIPECQSFVDRFMFSRVPEVINSLINPKAIESAMTDTGSTIKQKWDQVMQELFKLLIGFWEEALEKAEAKSIVFVTNEETSLVPFGALICSDGKYLIEKYEISNIGFLRLFKHCEMRRQYLLIGRREDRRALVVANPKKNLMYAEEEGKVVEKILQEAGLNPQCLTGDKAKVGTVSSILPQSCWIHMSCHTVFDNRIPNGSLELARSSELFDMICKFGALELAEDNQIANEHCNIRAERIQVTKTRRKDLLTVEEICEKELSAVVTVLGACSSGTGQICAEGTLGLTRAFHLAGVPTVVASLWQVNDEATKALMENFYSNMKDGLTVAAALQQSMISLMNEFEHPLYWAPFFVSGSPSSSLSDVSKPVCHVAL